MCAQSLVGFGVCLGHQTCASSWRQTLWTRSNMVLALMARGLIKDTQRKNFVSCKVNYWWHNDLHLQSSSPNKQKNQRAILRGAELEQGVHWLEVETLSFLLELHTEHAHWRMLRLNHTCDSRTQSLADRHKLAESKQAQQQPGLWHATISTA